MCKVKDESEMNSEIWSLILIYLYWNDTVRRVNVQWSPNIYMGDVGENSVLICDQSSSVS